MKYRDYSVPCLVLALLLSTSSCGGTASTADTAASDTSEAVTESAVKTRLDELGERDFGGKTFTILDDHGNVNVNVPDETLEGDTINDTVVNRNERIAEKYNIKFEYITGNSAAERADMVRKGVMAGEQVCDMFFSVIPTSMGPLATEGILADLSQSEYLTLDANYWSPLIYENCRIGGKMYYTTGDISPVSYRAPACYYANETLLEEYKISKSSLYTAIQDGKWTLDMMNELAGDLDRDLNGDNTFYADDDFFGILNENNNLTASCFMAASGVNLSSIDKDGKLYANLTDEKAVNAIDKLSKVLCKAPRKDSNALHTAFKNDRVVFLMHYASSGYTRYRDMTSNYIMLPLPKYDEKQETYRSLVNTWCNAFVCVPTNADLDRAGFIMEAMAYMSHDMLRPVAYDTAMKVKGTRNDEDAAVLDIIFDTMYLDFNSFMEFGGSISPIANAIFNNASYTSAIVGIADKMNAEMESFSQSWCKE